MIYSVWNQGAGVYDYFQTSEVQKVANTPAPTHLSRGSTSMLGLAPDHAAWPLPSSAVKMGSGTHPRGRIAHRNGGRALGGFGVDAVMSPVGLLVLAGIFLWWKKSK